MIKLIHTSSGIFDSNRKFFVPILTDHWASNLKTCIWTEDEVSLVEQCRLVEGWKKVQLEVSGGLFDRTVSAFATLVTC